SRLGSPRFGARWLWEPAGPLLGRGLVRSVGPNPHPPPSPRVGRGGRTRRERGRRRELGTLTPALSRSGRGGRKAEGVGSGGRGAGYSWVQAMPTKPGP